MLMRKNFGRALCLFSLAASFAFADAVPVAAFPEAGAHARDQQLREIRDVMRGGRGGFVDLGMNYTPLASQLPLKSPYGEHEGYAFRQHVAGFGSGAVTDQSQVGALLWFERSGWDGEDFLFYPQYNSFSRVSTLTTWGLTYTHIASDVTVAAGMQHYNVEHLGSVYPEEKDSLLYSWAHLRWSHFSLQGNFNRTDVRMLRLSLDLESRLVYGGRSQGILTYLPNIDFTVYNRSADKFSADTYRMHWEQNLYGQLLYAEVSFDFPDDGFHSAALKYYPDPSRMVAFEATCIRRNKKIDGTDDLLWGGAIEFPFVRFAYNSAYDYENFFHAKGTFIVEFQFNLASIDGFLFARGGTRSAPLETINVDKKNKDKLPEGDGLIHLNPSDGKTKTLEATGIRYEKSGTGNGGKQ
ncbi:hypothetical protein [uncultured Fibrobacter sp.]|uniref:hypothetical protein n=1 Tax=uncultured Fibrobacter sp. TaxID=261512 RepID=UPI0025CCFA9D|nr:hypothetical protein [uncultured Fibrobacter sp.]